MNNLPTHIPRVAFEAVHVNEFPAQEVEVWARFSLLQMTFTERKKFVF